MIRLYLVHSPRLTVEVLESSLLSNPASGPAGGTVRLVGAAPWGTVPVAELRTGPADVVLVEARETGSALPVVRELRDHLPHLLILPFDLEDEAAVVPFIEAGASGYLLRDAGLEDLVETVRALHRRRAPCAPSVAARVLARIVDLAASGRSRPSPPPDVLTPREREVLGLVADGLANKEIAAELDISLATVKNHVHSILAKLSVSRRRDAVRVAYETGLIDTYLPLRSHLRSEP